MGWTAQVTTRDQLDLADSYQHSALRASHSWEFTPVQRDGMTGRNICALSIVDYTPFYYYFIISTFYHYIVS